MGKVNQFYTAFACSFGSLVMGILNVWPSYTIGLYQSQNTTLLTTPMTDLESSLLGSLPSLGAMIGTAVAAYIIDSVGRKKGGLILALPYVLSWVIISYSSSSIVILIARFALGISAGAYLVYAPIFISEISEDSIRGALASGPITGYCLGALLSYLMGWFCTYSFIINLNIAASVLCAILPMTVAESPVYLLRQKRENDAREAISVYRGASVGSKVVLEVLSKLKQQINPAVELLSITDDSDTKEEKREESEKEKLNNENLEPIEEEKMSPFKILLNSAASNRAFKVVFTVLTFQVLMGLVPVQVYAKDLFAQAAPNLSSHFCSVIFALILVFACLSSAVFADMAGRRILIISSSIAVATCLVTLGLLLQTEIGPAWVAAVVILVYCYAFNFGAGTVPYLLLAEVFAPEVQSLASMLLVEWVWFTNFVIIGVFPFVKKLLGIHGIFYAFAGAAVANAVVSFFIVPETKGLSNLQIQEVFIKRRRGGSNC